MSLHVYESKTIFPYYKKSIEYLFEQRKMITDKETNIATNLCILLNLSCYLEGVLESKAKSVLEYYCEKYNRINIEEFEIRKPMNHLFYSFKEDCEKRISRCTGIEKYDEIFKLLLGKSIKSEPVINDCYESISVLGQLRNVIAHGREANAHILITDRENMTGIEDFNGGYKKAEDFLLKNSIITTRFIDTESVDDIFSDKVSDYFYEKSNSFILGLDKYISDNEKVEDIFDLIKSGELRVIRVDD